MKQSAKDKAKGTYHELKGAVKQKVGKATNNRPLQAEGLGEKLAGRLQKGIGQAEKALEKR
ncbi:MAG: CsbD family protein [Candidatus Acidiferrum sp.]